MRRKAATKAPIQVQQDISEKPENDSNIKSEQNDSGNGIVNDKEIVDENIVPPSKRGRKKVIKDLVDEKQNGSADIEKEVEKKDGEIESEKFSKAESVSDDNQEENVSASEKSAVAGKRGEKKGINKAAVSKRGRKPAVKNADSNQNGNIRNGDTASDKMEMPEETDVAEGNCEVIESENVDSSVPALKRGRKPVAKNQQDTSENAEDDKTEVTEKAAISKDSGTTENQNDSSAPESKNVSKPPGKRGRKKAEVKIPVAETTDEGASNSIEDKTKDEKSSNLSDDDFQASSRTAVVKKGGKFKSRNTGNKKEGNAPVIDFVPDEAALSEDKIVNEQLGKRGRKRKNKNEGAETEQDAKQSKDAEVSGDSMPKMKVAKVLLNRDDVLIENAKKTEVIDSDGIITVVAGPKGKATKRGKEKESKEEKPAKVPKKAEKAKKEKIPDVSCLDFSSDSKTPDGKQWNFKISSWNVNGIRAWLEKDGLTYLHHEKPDILCIQETKCSDDKLPDQVKKVDEYHAYWLSGDKDGYSGVGILSKEEPLKVEYGIGIQEHDNEGRVITAEYEKFFLVAAYVPNAGRGLVRLDYRMKWDKDFRAYLRKLDKQKPVILCGDLNVAHEEIDLANPKTNKKNAGFTQEEREGFSSLLKDNSFIDTFRHLHPDTTGAYTFWTYMMNARAKNVGWRLDYFVMSKRFEDNLCDNVIRKDVMGSDHCPITLFLAV